MSNRRPSLKQQSRAVRALHNLIVGREPRKETRKALMGDGAGHVIFPGQPNYVYIRLLSDTSALHIARNTTAPLMDNLPVTVEIHVSNNRVEYVVVGLATGLPAMTFPVQDVPQHSLSHERRWDGRGGWDAVDVYPRALVNLRARATLPASMAVFVEQGLFYVNDTLYQYAGGTSPVFVADGESYDLLTIDTDNVLAITAGAHTAFGAPLLPVAPAGTVPIVAVRLSTGLTSLTETQLLLDVRPFLNIGSTGGISVEQPPQDNRRSWMGI